MAVTDEDVRQIINACAGCCCKLCSAEVHDRVVRLQAALSLPVSNTGGWQPIETAPKDGTRILAFARGKHGPNDVYYGVSSWVNADPDVNPGIPIEQLSLWAWSYAIRPTHWTPLPEAPL